MDEPPLVQFMFPFAVYFIICVYICFNNKLSGWQSVVGLEKFNHGLGQNAATMKNIFTGGMVQWTDAGKVFFILPDCPQA
jgi:hypothetical protein